MRCPVVVLLGEHGADEADDGWVVGEDLHDVGASFDFLFSRSSGLFDQILRQWSGGNAEKASTSPLAVSISSFTFGNWRANMSAVRSQAAAISTGFGCTNTVRSAAATTSWCPLGTRASTLRAKWTRHRCQLAPCNVLRAAAFRPSCASEITNLSPRRRSDRRNSVQKDSSSLSPTARPSTSRSPPAVIPVAITTARDTT